MRTIVRLQKLCGIEGWPLDTNLSNMYYQYKKLVLSYREFKILVTTTSTIFQYTQIEELTLTGKAEVSAVRQRVQYLETMRSQNRRIRLVLGNYNGTGVT